MQKGRKMQKIQNNTPLSFKGFDYYPCLMNQKQIDLTEKLYKTISGTNTYKVADKHNVDFIAIPKGEDAIDVFMTDNYYERDVKNNNRLVKTPFRTVEVPSEFKHKVNRLIDKMNIYLEKVYCEKVK